MSGSSISERFVMDLIEKVRETAKITADELKDLTIAIRSMVDSYSTESKITDKNHKEVMAIIQDTNKETKNITKSIKTIILTMIIAFTLLGSAFFIANWTVKTMVEHQVNTYIEQLKNGG